MSSDPMDAMLSYDDAAYDVLSKEADIDNRVGKHNAIVSKVTDDLWPSGDPRRKIVFTLLTANNAKADLTWSEPPPPDVIMAQKDSWESGKKKAIANAVAIARQFIQHYGTHPLKVTEGQEFRVETIKTRKDKDGSGGFIRVIALLPKADAESSGAVATGAGGRGPGF